VCKKNPADLRRSKPKIFAEINSKINSKINQRKSAENRKDKPELDYKTSCQNNSEICENLREK
jgi:hypothetical protein